MVAAAAELTDDVIDTKRVLIRLMQSDGFDINENMELESVTVLRDKLRKLTVSIITRLGNPFGDKTDDDYNARKLVQDMEDDVASYSQPSNPNSTRFHVRVVICSEAAYCLHLM